MLSSCQNNISRPQALSYEPNDSYPFGRLNPEAPRETSQFSFMIGQNNCSEERLNSASGHWDSGTRTWDAKYTMNGFAILDSGMSGSSTNGNMRVFDAESGQWKVTFFSMPTYGSSVWSGGVEGENIVLKQPQLAPGTDFEGNSTLTFSNISTNGFDWLGAWVSLDGSTVFPFWRISCTKISS